MSKMKEMCLNVLEMFDDGLDAHQIAEALDCSVDFVYECLEFQDKPLLH